ncbi:hypothetical protein THOG05_710001 [Vibrio rotiferianus]|nr:hypothetical protein THOG05_710001 [Vibrio rotiferianus]
MVERRTVNPQVTGSSPVGGANFESQVFGLGFFLIYNTKTPSLLSFPSFSFLINLPSKPRYKLILHLKKSTYFTLKI